MTAQLAQATNAQTREPSIRLERPEPGLQRGIWGVPAWPLWLLVGLLLAAGLLRLGKLWVDSQRRLRGSLKKVPR
jgi:hypothetical protein